MTETELQLLMGPGDADRVKVENILIFFYFQWIKLTFLTHYITTVNCGQLTIQVCTRCVYLGELVEA